MNITFEAEPLCPFKTAQTLFAGKYKPEILLMLTHDTLRYSNLARRMPGVSPKVLTQQLREMEADGLIIRTIFPEVPPKVEYSLTQLGKSARPILEAMRDWGEEYLRACDKEPNCGACAETPWQAAHKWP